MCSTVCRCTRSCGTGSVTRPWPHPPLGVFLVVQLEERLEKGSLPDLGRVLRLVALSPSPFPGCVLAPWSAVLGVHLVERVVQHRCQGHADGLLLVTKPRAHPPLSASLCDSSSGSLAGLSHEQMQRANKSRSPTCLSLVCCLLFVVCCLLFLCGS